MTSTRRFVSATLAATIVFVSAPPRLHSQANQASLKIVVIQGEDAVNIIQQKTAVAPIVEVRDRNDLPVAGVPVTFSVTGSSSTLGSGLQTVTVTTNAAGRAAVTAVNPISPGAYQINVSASAQGQTATAAITQTNFATVAAATAAGATVAGVAAAAGAAGGAGGGGLSGAAIAGIVGGIGAGAYVGARAAGLGGGDDATTTDQPCTFTVSPTSFSVASSGGNLTANVTASPEGCLPNSWTATSNASFITFGQSGSTTSGNGTGAVSIFVPINASGNAARSGTLTIAGQTVTVSQTAQCGFTIAPTSLTFPAAGGTAPINMTVFPAGCDNPAWSVRTISTFIGLSPTSGNGNGVVTVTVGRNAFTTPLTGNIEFFGLAGLTTSGNLVNVVQQGSGPNTPGGLQK